MRETGLEPASTYVHMNLNHARLPIPPFPQKMVGRGGFEPPKLIAADLQSAPFGHSGTYPYDFPLDPKGGAGDGTRTRNLLITNQLLCQLSYASTKLKSAALPIELRQHEALPNTAGGSDLESGDPEGARTLDLQRDRLAL